MKTRSTNISTNSSAPPSIPSAGGLSADPLQDTDIESPSIPSDSGQISAPGDSLTEKSWDWSFTVCCVTRSQRPSGSHSRFRMWTFRSLKGLIRLPGLSLSFFNSLMPWSKAASAKTKSASVVASSNSHVTSVFRNIDERRRERQSTLASIQPQVRKEMEEYDKL